MLPQGEDERSVDILLVMLSVLVALRSRFLNIPLLEKSESSSQEAIGVKALGGFRAARVPFFCARFFFR